MMTQNEIRNSIQYAKDLAKAEKELGIVPWVSISFEINSGPTKPNIPLYRIDLPRHMLERWSWVINWRRAKLICRYPRKNISTYYSYYDKNTSLNTGFKSLLYILASTKAQVTKVKRMIQQYIDYNRRNNLFFNAETDEQLCKAHIKLKKKEENVEKMLIRLKEEVEQHKNTTYGTE